jgi:hypothetical protein
MKKIVTLLILIISTNSISAPLMVCEDLGLDTGFGRVDVRLEVNQIDPKSFSATMSLSQDGAEILNLKQSSFYLWSTFGAEVLIADGKYTEVFPDGTEEEIAGQKFVISRMLAPEGAGLVSVDFKSSSGNIGYITRSCRMKPQ